MKTCVSSYSYGKYRAAENMGMMGIIDHAAENGFDGIEFIEGLWQQEPDGAKKIKERCIEKGIEPVAFLIGAELVTRDRIEEIARIRSLIDTAEELGVKMLRHDLTSGYPNNVKLGRSFDCILPELADRVREIAKYAEQKGIKTMSENHGFFVQDSDRVEKLINEVNHPNYGALVDLGNFMCADEDPNKAVGVMAPYAFHVHAKDFFLKSGMTVNPGNGWFRTRAGNYLRGTIIGHGDANIPQSIGILKRKGYDGYITVEFEGIEDNLFGITEGRNNIIRFWDMF